MSHPTVTKLLAATLLALHLGQAPASAQAFRSPDIVVLGDSQLSFGAGPVFLDFLKQTRELCSPFTKMTEKLDRLAGASVGIIGVRSSSLPSWTGRERRAKGAICDVDPKWKVNAGSYGTINTSDNPYVQIGRGPAYEFCQPSRSPLEAMFRSDYYKPKLLIMYFLGNSADRWSSSYDKALSDVRATLAQLPRDLPCIFMTTAPAFDRKTLALRLRAQTNVARAFAASGMQCSFVAGQTPATIETIVGNPAYFRRDPSGRIKDPFHPNTDAARAFIKIQRRTMCEAIVTQLARTAPRPTSRK